MHDFAHKFQKKLWKTFATSDVSNSQIDILFCLETKKSYIRSNDIWVITIFQKREKNFTVHETQKHS